MAFVHPDSDGLQVATAQTPHLEVANQFNSQQATGYFATNEKYPAHDPNHKYVHTPETDSQKMLHTPPGAPLTSPGVSSCYSEEKQTQQAGLLVQPDQRELPPTPTQHSRSRRRLWTAVILLAIIIAVAVAVPTGVILGRKAQSSETPPAPANNASAADAGFLPYNGTYFGTIEPGLGSDKLWLYWQNADGDIRMSRLNGSNVWEPSVSMNIANKAKGTPLAATLHGVPGLSGGVAHLVYVTEDGYYADIVNEPQAGNTWIDGGLYAQLRPCPHDLRFSMAWADTNNGTSYFYTAGVESAFYNEYIYDAALKMWSIGIFTVFGGTSAYGGILVQQWNASITALHVVNSKDNIASWYRNYDNSTSQTWQRMGESYGPVHANSSLAAPHTLTTNNITYYQQPNSNIGLVYSGSPENGTTWTTFSSETPSINIPAMSGTALHANTITLYEGGTQAQMMVLFLQQHGNDITIYSGMDPTHLAFNGTITQ